MSDKLVEKIRKLLDSSVNTESVAVHFLSLVRGVAERDGAPEGTSFALKMYCHWAMHISLTYAHTTKGFLKQVDDFVLRNVSPGNSPKWPADYKYEGPMSFSDEHYLFREFIYLDNLRRDLKLFLGKYVLGGHPKSGQWWSPQNRPIESSQDKGGSRFSPPMQPRSKTEN